MSDGQVAGFAIDSLRQLSIKFIEKGLLLKKSTHNSNGSA
jgi:hypothetical protein